MRLILIALILSVFQGLALESVAQSSNLNLKMNDVTIAQVLNSIENQTDYFFLYNSKLVDVEQSISVDVQDLDIEKTLKQIFTGTGIRYEIVNRQILLSNQNENFFQQGNIKVTGKVNDSSGVPLPGVTVVVKGTTQGTITDFEGNYMVSDVPSDATLVFSFVGMETQEIQVNGKTEIDITLQEDAIGIEEVVAIGYGTQKKVDLTGAISTVKGDALMKAPIPNLSSALTGKVTGLTAVQASGQPGFDGASIQIRGKSTTGNNDPLVIVDGVVRPMSRIDPNDIESISVLKDAASTAVYGARAANGVLLITTKRGGTGKPSYTYSGSIGFQTQTRKMEMMNAYEYAKYINEAKANYNEDLLFTDEEIAQFKSGEKPSYDWMDAVFSETPQIQKHNISVSGGTQKTKYFLSYGYLDQDGLYPAAKYKQNNIRSNIDVSLTDRLNFAFNMGGRIEDRYSSPSAEIDIYQQTVYSRPYLKPILEESDGVPAGSLGHNNAIGSPIGSASQSGSVNRKNYVFESSFNLNYDIPGIEGLIAKAFFSFDFNTFAEKTLKHPYDVYQLNEITGEYTKVSGGFSTISLEEKRYRENQKTLQLSLNYKKKFDNHNIGALLLFEQMETFNNSLQAFRDDFISTAIPELFAGGVDKWSNDGSSGEAARRGYVGRFDYDYKGKYLFQANMRLDQSFNFPKKGRNGFFPAFSAGWRISQEDFMKNIDAISNLKLKASWGMVGNDRVSNFQYLSNMEFSGGTVIGNTFKKGIRQTGVANPNITWETATTTDIGIDLGLFKNKLTFEGNYFKKRTEDILRPNSGVVPSTFGASLPDENIGIVDSWGTEFALNYQNNIGELYISLGANISWYDNKAVYVAEAEDVLPAIAQTGRALGLRVGYLSNGLFQTQEEIDNSPIQFSESNHNSLQPGDIRYVDINGRDQNGELTGEPDGKINGDDRTIVASSGDPNTVFGVNINMEYKGFDLTANFQGATNYSRDYHSTPFERDNNSLRIFVDSWRPGNENARYPLLHSGDLTANSDQPSDFWITEVTFVKLRNLELGYSFVPFKSAFTKVGIENVRLFLAGNNLLTISNVDWRDPEGNSGRFPFYPQVKTMTIGLNVNF